MTYIILTMQICQKRPRLLNRKIQFGIVKKKKKTVNLMLHKWCRSFPITTINKRDQCCHLTNKKTKKQKHSLRSGSHRETKNLPSGTDTSGQREEIRREKKDRKRRKQGADELIERRGKQRNMKD